MTRSRLKTKGGGPLGCPNCHIRFATAEERIQHAREKHKVHLSNYTCTACKLAGYGTADALQLHLKTKCFGSWWETCLGENTTDRNDRLVTSVINSVEKASCSSKSSLKRTHSKSLSLDKSESIPPENTCHPSLRAAMLESAINGDGNTQEALEISILPSIKGTQPLKSTSALFPSRKRKTSAPAGKSAKIPRKELDSCESESKISGLPENQKKKSVTDFASVVTEPKNPCRRPEGLAKPARKKSFLLENLKAPLLKKKKRSRSDDIQSIGFSGNSSSLLETKKTRKKATLSDNAPEPNMLSKEMLMPTSSKSVKKSRSKRLPPNEVSEDSSQTPKKITSKEVVTKCRFSQTESDKKDVTSVSPSGVSHLALTTVAASTVGSRTRANSMLSKRDINGDVFINESTKLSEKSDQKCPKKEPSLNAASDSSKPLTECNTSAPSMVNGKNAIVIVTESSLTEEVAAINHLEKVIKEDVDIPKEATAKGSAPETQGSSHFPEESHLDSKCKSQINVSGLGAKDVTEAVLSIGTSKKCEQNVEIGSSTQSSGKCIDSSDLQQQNIEFTNQSESTKDRTKSAVDTKHVESVEKIEQKYASEEAKPESSEFTKSADLTTPSSLQESFKAITSVSDELKPLGLLENEKPTSLKDNKSDSTDASLDIKRLELKRLRESLGIGFHQLKPFKSLTSSNANGPGSPVTPPALAIKSPSPSSLSSSVSSNVSGKFVLLDWDSFIARGPRKSRPIQQEQKKCLSEEKPTVITHLESSVRDNFGVNSKSKLQSTEMKSTTASKSLNVSANGPLNSEKTTASTTSGDSIKPNFGVKLKSKLQRTVAESTVISRKTLIPNNDSPLNFETSTTTANSRGYLKPNAEEKSKSKLQIEGTIPSSSKNTEISNEDSTLNEEPQESNDSNDRMNTDDASSISTVPLRQEIDDKVESESDVDSEAQSGQNERMTMLSCPVCRLGGFATKAELKVHLTISCHQEPKKKKKVNKERRPIEWYCPGCPRSFGPFESAKALLDHLPTCHIRRVALFGAGGRGKGKTSSLDPNDLPLWPLPLPSTPVTFGCPVCGCFFATASRLDQHRSEADHFHIVGRFLNTNGHFKSSK